MDFLAQYLPYIGRFLQSDLGTVVVALIGLTLVAHAAYRQIPDARGEVSKVKVLPRGIGPALPATTLGNWSPKTPEEPQPSGDKSLYEQWDPVDSFTVIQAACLWCDRQPMDKIEYGWRKSSNMRAVEQMLVAAISKGQLLADSSKNALHIIGNYEESLVARGDLVEFAAKKGQRPKFLFPGER